MLFDPSLLCFFGSAAHSPLSDSMWSFGFCLTLLVGSFVPFISFWTSLAHLLFLTFLGHFLNSAFPWVFTNSFELFWANYLILGAHGLAINPYFLCLHYFGFTVAHSHFSTLHTVYGFATSLSSSSFRPICFLKAHLFMSRACNPLFLPLGLNGFSIHLLTLFCPYCWASSFYLTSQNEHCGGLFWVGLGCLMR